MRVIRPHGSSEILENEKKEEVRGIIPKKTDKLTTLTLNDYFQDEIDFHIALWISTIDKIYRKPKNGDLITEEQFKKLPKDEDDAKKKNIKKKSYQSDYIAVKNDNFFIKRTELGKACFKKFEKRFSLHKEEIKLWEAKIHPYFPSADKANEFYIKKNKMKEYHGNWYSVFFGSDGKATPEQAAEKIEAHLYQKALRIKSGGKTENRIGVKEKKLTAIAKSVHPKEKAARKSAIVAAPVNDAMMVWYKYTRNTDIIKAIYDAYLLKQKEYIIYQNLTDDEKKKLKEKPSAYGSIEIAAKALHEHWGKIFFGCNTHADAQKKDAALYAIHLAVKEYYKNLIKKGDNRLSNLINRLPKNAVEMQKRLFDIKQNKDVNFYIRLGKMLHYTDTIGTNWGTDFSKVAEKLKKSPYHNAEGQHKIKQDEAFVKVWLTAITSAARTLQGWVDPKKKLSEYLKKPEHYDLLIDGKKRNIDEKTKQPHEMIKENVSLTGTYFFENFFNIADMQTQSAFLFGSIANTINDEKKAKDLITVSLKLLSHLRNNAFHFKNFKMFIKALESQEHNKGEKFKNLSGTQNNDFIKALYDTDLAGRAEKIKKTLEGLKVEQYLSKEQAQKIIEALNIDNDALITLPKFSLLLQRIENVPALKTQCNLPDAPSQKEFEANKDLKMQYAVMKELYDKPFRAWVESDGQKERWQAKANNAYDIAEKSAKNMNGKTTPDILLSSRVKKIVGEVSGFKTLSDLFYRLTAETAKEMRVQKGYESDGEAAKEQAKFIENFKCDIIGQLFSDYLKEEGFGFLRPGGISKKPVAQFEWDKPDAPTAPARENNFEQWQANLYFILHLIPVEEVNRLLHQMRKWIVVTEKINRCETEREQAKQFAAIMTLYTEMHDAKFIDNENITDFKKFKSFYENENDFNKIFFPVNEKRKDELIPIRGLREMLRYGDMNVGFLQGIFKGSVKKESLTNWNEKYPDRQIIDTAHKEKTDLHKKWSEYGNKSEWVKTNGAAYKKELKTVSEYDRLKNTLYLIDHKNVHRLLMQILGRLVGFAHHFERDWYFITLAVCYENKKSLEDCLGKDGLSYLKNGQINAVFNEKCYKEKDDKKYEVSEIIKNGVQALFPWEKPEKIRNDLAHFNMLNDKSKAENFSVTDWINKTRTLMAYDRKMKNSVAKAIKELLEQENLLATWDITKKQHELELCCIETQKIKHLEGKFTEDAHSGAFVNMVKTLLSGGEAKATQCCQEEENKKAA